MDAPEEQPAPPRPNWVMGRSARWHTAEGRALLTEQAAADADATSPRLVAAPLALRDLVGPVDAVSVVFRLARELRRVHRRNR